MRIFILTITFAVTLSATGSPDSTLTNALESKSDFLRVEKYVEVGMEWLNSDLDSAKHYADLALKLSEENNSHHLLETQRLFLFIHFYRGDYTESIKTAHLLHNLTDKSDKIALSAAFNNLGLMYMTSENYEMAEAYYDSALIILPQNAENLQGRIDLYNNLGILKDRQGNVQGAIEKSFQALELFDPKEDPENAVSLYQNLSNYYLTIQDTGNALKYATMAFEIKSDLNMVNTIGTTLATIGDIYLVKGLTDSAETYFTSALTNYQELGNKRAEGAMLHSLAQLFRDRNELQLALESGLKSEKIKADYGTAGEYINTRYLLAQIYGDLGRLEEANSELDYAESVAKEIGYKNLLREVYREQSKVKELLGWPEKALNYERMAYDLNLELLDEERVNAIVKTEGLYENKLKTAEIKALTAESELAEANLNRHRLYLIIAGISAALLITLIIALYRRMKNRRRLHEKEKLALEKEIELTALRSIMSGEEQERIRIARDLHDGLSGQLSAVKMKLSVVEHQSQELKFNDDFKIAIQTLSNAGNEVRRIAHNMAPPALDQYGLIEALRNYLMDLDGIKGVKIKYSHTGFTQPVGRKIERELFLIVQEVVNNSIKHSKASNITVGLIKSDAGIKLLIEDDGIGFDIKNLKSPGMGISNIYGRVKTLSGDIQIETKPNQGTTVCIEVLPRLEIAI